MKKIAAALILTLCAGLAQAHGYSRPPAYYHHGYSNHYHHGSGYHNGRWVAPLIIGGVVGYTLSRPAPIYSYPAPVVVAPYAEPAPTWAPPPGFHYEQRLDAGCNCWRWFVVANPN